MIDPDRITTISNLRFKTSDVFDDLENGPMFLFQRSAPKGVLLSIKTYQALLDELEELKLSLIANKFVAEDKETVEWKGHEAVVKEVDV